MLHSNEKDDTNIKNAIEIFSQYDAYPVVINQGMEYYSIKRKCYRKYLNKLFELKKDKDAWFIYSDLDEFIDFGDDAIGFLGNCRSNVVGGELIERVCPSLELEDVRLDIPILEQFSLKLKRKATKHLGFGTYSKICATKLPVYVWEQGHHRVKKNYFFNLMRFPKILKVSHIRFSKEFISNYNRRLSRKNKIWNKEKVRVLLDECEGTYKLNDTIKEFIDD
jgi:hypothetical protein